jgi:hypothetical protein
MKARLETKKGLLAALMIQGRSSRTVKTTAMNHKNLTGQQILKTMAMTRTRNLIAQQMP